MGAETLRIVPFRPEDQAGAKALVMAGLAERWGTVDPDLNPDLDDLATTYADSAVLLAWSGDDIVGFGILVPRANGVHEVVRMSVASAYRRQGIATRLLAALVAEAERRGARRIELETSASWHEARAFYLAFGFQFSHEIDGDFGPDAYYFLDLASPGVIASSDD